MIDPDVEYPCFMTNRTVASIDVLSSLDERRLMGNGQVYDVLGLAAVARSGEWLARHDDDGTLNGINQNVSTRKRGWEQLYSYAFCDKGSICPVTNISLMY